ncbi:MAG: hypothetical protein U9N46_01680, partial [Euryarchaeota archaeon]|nr:hypothetical protein [Euryarchaeota archaeon]
FTVQEKPVAIGSIQLERCFRSSTKMKQKWDQFSTGYTHPFITIALHYRVWITGNIKLSRQQLLIQELPEMT